MADELSMLIADLSDPNTSRCLQAVQRLARLGEEAQPAAVPLVRLCAEKDESLRSWAASALEELGPPSPSDLPALVELLDDPKADVGYWAATLLGRLGARAAPATQPLAQRLLYSPHANVRQRAAWALGKIGPGAKDARDALRQAAAADDARLARLAQQALGQVQP